MPGNDLAERILALPLKAGTGTAMLRDLALERFFDTPVTSSEVVRGIGERFSQRWSTSEVQPYAAPLVRSRILYALKPEKRNHTYWVAADVPREEALRMLRKGRKMAEIEEQLFSTALLQKLAIDFQAELDELHDNFGRSGNATAFLLRKILEKLLIIVMGKLGKEALLEDKTRPGGWRGLEATIDIAAREKVKGLPLLTGKTATEIKGIKFLGDTAAHNPLVNVQMTTILPQMPYIITAYEELARHL